ncbi:hypothetical protein B0T17DRAFT_489613, partial [Bombardia bombarda]
EPNMPSRANSTTTKPSGTTVPGKRFELPVLDFKFSSLTDGTDIPPPLPSPVLKAAPTPPETPNGKTKKAVNGSNKVDTASPSSIYSAGGTKVPTDENPASPTLSSRPGSIRRLFSRNLLNTAYTNGEEPANADTASAVRPPSHSSNGAADPKKPKRSSGWFNRLRNHDTVPDKRVTTPLSPTSPVEERKPKGPPPPMIPELSELKSKLDIKDEGGFGNDLFKDIK